MYWLQERNEKLEVFWGMALIDGVLRIQAQDTGEGMSILDLASLHSFSGNRTLIILLAAATCFKIDSLGGFFPPDSLLYILPADFWCWLQECLISAVLLTGIAAALRDAEHLLWEEIFGYVCLSFYSPLEGWEDNLSGNWLPGRWPVWNLFCRCQPLDISWWQLSFPEPQALWIEVHVCKGDHVVVTQMSIK